MGKLISVDFIDNESSFHKDASMTGIPMVLYLYLVVSIAAFVLSYFLIESEPASAPSNSTRVRSILRHRLLSIRMERNEGALRDEYDPAAAEVLLPPSSASRDASATKTIFAQCGIILRESDSRLLMASFGFGPMIVLCFLFYSTKVYLPSSCGGKPVDYGIIVGSALIGSCTANLAASMTNSYLFSLKVASALGLCAISIFMFITPLGAVLHACLGFVSLTYSSILALYIENMLECTYPISEDISLGVLLTFAYSVVGLPVSFIVKRLMANTETDSCRIGTDVKLFVISSSVLGLILLLRCNASQKRTRYETQRRGSEEEPLLPPELP